MKTENTKFADLPLKDQAQIVLDDYLRYIALYQGVTAPFGDMSDEKARKKHRNLDWASVDDILVRCANATLHAYQFLGVPVPKKNAPIIFHTVATLAKVVETGELPK